MKPGCPTCGGLLRIHSHASTANTLNQATQSKVSQQLAAAQATLNNQEIGAFMVCPAADATEQGSEYGCSDKARSRTRPACRLFRTPPLRIYIMKPGCPTCGGLLRIHSHASTANTLNQATQSKVSQQLAAAQAQPNNQEIGAFMVCPAADATEQGSEYGCSDKARSRTRPACRLFRTPPLRIYIMKPGCPTCGGLLRIHSHASTAHTLNQATQSKVSQQLAAA